MTCRSATPWTGRRHSDFPTHILSEDDVAIAFLDKYPRVAGYTLLAPRAHRTGVTRDFAPEEYLALQGRLHRVAEAVREEMHAERLYLLALGSDQGKRPRPLAHCATAAGDPLRAATARDLSARHSQAVTGGVGRPCRAAPAAHRTLLRL